jgi:hypothetical protein
MTTPSYEQNVPIAPASPQATVAVPMTTFVPGYAVRRLDHGPATAEQIEDQDYYCDNNQQVNQVAADAADKTQQPQNEKNDEDCPKHGTPPSLSFLCL